jgi:PBSX family phage terminase large subunit
MNIEIDPRIFNPVYWHLKDAFQNDNIFIILLYGGSDASKTYSIVQYFALEALQRECSTITFRKESTSIADSIYADYTTIGRRINLGSDKEYYHYFINRVICNNTKFRFRGLDDSEKIKGISSYLYVHLNEISSFELSEFNEIKRRLRGRPGQKIIADWNPISDEHWIKTEVINKNKWINLPLVVDCPKGAVSQLDNEYAEKSISEDGKILLIKTSYRDNFWCVGHPDGIHGYKDENALYTFERMRIESPYDYQIYGLGNWGKIRTGGEFLKGFKIETHVKQVNIEQSLIHISIDSNVFPYIAVTAWQLIKKDKWIIRQIHELPCKDPDNTARKAGERTAQWLRSIGYKARVSMYGDRSTKNRNNIDDNKMSFYQIFTDAIKKHGYQIEDKFLNLAPPVSMIADFVNAIFDQTLDFAEIEISEKCKVSINDYIETKQDKDGSMLKKRIEDKILNVSYEPHGHLTDTLKDFIVQAFYPEFNKFQNRFAAIKPGGISHVSRGEKITF